MSKDSRQKGTALYLAILIMAVLLAASLGLHSILKSQFQMVRSMGYSVIAFYAADAGIEKVLIGRETPSDIPETSLSNGASYQVTVQSSGAGGCTADHYCITSVGKYHGTRRAIEVLY